MPGSSIIQEDTGYRNNGIFMPYKDTNILDYNNSNPDVVDMEDISLEVDTRNVTLSDIIEGKVSFLPANSPLSLSLRRRGLILLCTCSSVCP